MGLITSYICEPRRQLADLLDFAQEALLSHIGMRKSVQHVGGQCNKWRESHSEKKPLIQRTIRRRQLVRWQFLAAISSPRRRLRRVIDITTVSMVQCLERW